MIKHVLIGCGSIADLMHMPSLALLQNEMLLDVVGVADVNAKRAELVAGKYGVPNWGTDWQALVGKTGATAVSVCLPPGPNANISAQALERGLHVLCEKPPGRDLPDAERMAKAAAARPDLITMVGFNRRYAPLYVRVMESAARLGRPHAFYGRFTRASLGAAPSNTAADWITSDGSHAIDLALATLGYPHAIAVSRARVGSGPDNVWTLQLNAESGSALLLFDFAAGRRVERFELSGPGYDAVMELPDCAEWSQQGVETVAWKAADETQTASSAVNYGFLGEYRAFALAIAGAIGRPTCDFAHGLAFMRLVKDILDSPSSSSRLVCLREASSRKTDVEPESSTATLKSNKTMTQRPVVRIWQPPAWQPLFFTQQRLTAMAADCDLRLQFDGEPLEKDLAEVNALVLGWYAPALTPELIARAKNLSLVVAVGSSVKHIHPELLIERGILVCSTSDAVAQSVAEHCLLGALAGLRRLTDVDRKMHAGGWPPTPPGGFSLRKVLSKGQAIPGVNSLKPLLLPLVRRIAPPPPRRSGAAGTAWSDLDGQTVGLIGWGHIARHFARLLGGFNCQLLVNSSAITPEELSDYGAQSASMGEIFGSARVISLHKGMTEQTKGLIGSRELALMRPGAVLINTARAGLVEEHALVSRLRQGDIVAVLDVFHREPLPAKHPLRRLRNVILTPHNSGKTPECYRRVGEQSLGLVQDWIKGKIPSDDESFKIGAGDLRCDFVSALGWSESWRRTAA